MHQGSAGLYGTASDIKIQAEQWNLSKQEMAELTAQHTGQSVEEIIRTVTATAGSPPRKRSSTASWITSSPGPARSLPACRSADGEGADRDRPTRARSSSTL